MAADAATLAAQDRGTTVLAVVIAFLALSTAFIVLRLVSRFGVVKKVGNDDYAIILAWVSDTRISWDESDETLIAISFLRLGCHSPSAMERELD